MVAQFRERRDYIMARLREIPGLSIAEPQGAFYVLPDVSAYFGPDVHAADFGPVPDSDTLCRRALDLRARGAALKRECSRSLVPCGLLRGDYG